MSFSPDKLMENEFYHGTQSYKAIKILYEGFRLKKYYANYGGGGTFKQGTYLTKSLSSAQHFGDEYVFKCRLKKGISILKIDGEYDQKVINYLKREFKKGIITEHLSKVIHRNKHLTKNELIHLLNYRYTKADFWWRDSMKWYDSVSSFRQHLQFHKYDGFGETKNFDGLVIFNPSLVEPIKLFKIYKVGEKPSEFDPKFKEPVFSLKEINNLRFMDSIDKYYNDYVKSSPEEDEHVSQEDIREWEHIRSLQRRFRRENIIDP